MTTVFFAGGGTGGHLNPGLAIARALVAAEPSIRPFFIGAKRGIEATILPDSEFPFRLFDLHPLYRKQPWNNWRTVTSGFSAWRQVARLAKEINPRALVATGGYAAAVGLAYAARVGLPIVLQEQNSYPGATVRLFSRYALQIHLGFPEAAKHLKTGKLTRIFQSGNPIDPPPFDRISADDAALEWGFDREAGPVILIFGGSQGAEAINQAVAHWLEERQKLRVDESSPALQIIWSTGAGNYDRYKHLESKSVVVRPFINPMSQAYAAADLAVCRSGAMTIAELSAWRIPAVFIPLPGAAADHQTANARAVEGAGAGVVLPQNKLNSQSLAETVNKVAFDSIGLELMRERALQRARPESAQDIANHILKISSLK